MKRRYQFIWWGLDWLPLFRFHRLAPDESLSSIYSWTLVVGPIEVRRWAR